MAYTQAQLDSMFGKNLANENHGLDPNDANFVNKLHAWRLDQLGSGAQQAPGGGNGGTDIGQGGGTYQGGPVDLWKGPSQFTKGGNAVDKLGDFMTDGTIAGKIGQKTDFTGIGMGIANISKGIASALFGGGDKERERNWAKNVDIQQGKYSGNRYQAVGQEDSAGDIVSLAEWTSKGKNYTEGAGGSSLDARDYQNYVDKTRKALAEGDTAYADQLRQMHGFKARFGQGAAGPAATGGGGGGGAAPAQLPAGPDGPPATEYPRDEVTKPGDGLEGTIKSYDDGPEARKRRYLYEQGGAQRGTIRTDEEETRRRRSALTRSYS